MVYKEHTDWKVLYTWEIFFPFSVTTQRALLETDHAICLYIEDTGIFKYVIQIV